MVRLGGFIVQDRASIFSETYFGVWKVVFAIVLGIATFFLGRWLFSCPTPPAVIREKYEQLRLP